MALVTNGKATGLINVVAYGYHNFQEPQSYKGHQFYLDGQDEAAFIASFAEERRKIEVQFVERLVQGLRGANQPAWMLTVVNKQDLWWHDRDAVRSHYENGEYNAIIQTLAERSGTARFEHDYLPASLTIANLTTPAGEVLARDSSGYDHSMHASYANQLLRRIL